MFFCFGMILYPARPELLRRASKAYSALSLMRTCLPRETPKGLVCSDTSRGRPAYSIPPLAVRPVHSLSPISDIRHLTTAFSSTSALFVHKGPTQVVSHQSFSHSFPFNGGWGVSVTTVR